MDGIERGKKIRRKVRRKTNLLLEYAQILLPKKLTTKLLKSHLQIHTTYHLEFITRWKTSSSCLRQVRNSFRGKNISSVNFCEHNPRATFYFQSYKYVSIKSTPFTTVFAFITSSPFPTLYDLWKGKERKKKERKEKRKEKKKEKKVKKKKRKRMFDVPSAVYALYSLDLHRHVVSLGLQQQRFEGHDLGISWNTCLFVVKKVLRCLADSGPQ